MQLPEATFTVMNSTATEAMIYAYRDVFSMNRTLRGLEISLAREGVQYKALMEFEDADSANEIMNQLKEDWDAWIRWETHGDLNSAAETT